MNAAATNPFHTLLFFARQLVAADDAQSLDQRLVDLLRSACEACERPPEQYDSIPTVDGLYWYHQLEGEPEPVLISHAHYSGRFKAFNGREQNWLRAGEFFTGPVQPPSKPRG